jgi:aminoglycoside 2''-phosphotransferase
MRVVAVSDLWEGRAVDTADVLQALADIDGLAVQSVRQIRGGWASWTFVVNDRLIVRFPRTAEIAASIAAELRLLPRLASLVDFAVPQIRWSGVHNGLPYFVYEAIPGRPLQSADLDARLALADDIARSLQSLHSVPPSIVGDPARALGDWRAKYERLHARAHEAVLPLLDSRTAKILEQAWRLFESSLAFTPAVVHADLGVEHLLVEKSHLVGIIDWETACLGDPAIDFAGRHIAVGSIWTARILDAYAPNAGALADRVSAYAWLASVHSILYGLDEQRTDIVTDGIAGLHCLLSVGP